MVSLSKVFIEHDKCKNLITGLQAISSALRGNGIAGRQYPRGSWQCSQKSFAASAPLPTYREYVAMAPTEN
jgi:hypothetical protein